MSAPQTKALDAFTARMAEKHITPLWTVANRLVMREPTPKIPSVFWSYQRDVRPYILEAAEVISAAEAHRRVLVLNNPPVRLRQGGGLDRRGRTSHRSLDFPQQIAIGNCRRGDAEAH